jgi:hypothetical protein
MAAQLGSVYSLAVFAAVFLLVERNLEGQHFRFMPECWKESKRINFIEMYLKIFELTCSH